MERKDIKLDNQQEVGEPRIDVIEIPDSDLLPVSPSQDENNQKAIKVLYLLLPAIFMSVALLGGMRLASADGAFVFLKPALICLVYASILLVLFFRGNLLDLHGWFSEDFSGLKNIANAAVLLTLFAASTQLFNSLLPEAGLPFWIVAFCFFWTLWNNLFLGFDAKSLLRSIGGLFGLAFVAKYLILINLVAPTNDNWLKSIFENPGREAFTWLLDLPRFSAGTGYIQFFTVALYLISLSLLPRSTRKSKQSQ